MKDPFSSSWGSISYHNVPPVRENARQGFNNININAIIEDAPRSTRSPLSEEL